MVFEVAGKKDEHMKKWKKNLTFVVTTRVRRM